jgi:hypothetical protein
MFRGWGCKEAESEHRRGAGLARQSLLSDDAASERKIASERSIDADDGGSIGSGSSGGLHRVGIGMTVRRADCSAFQ